MRARHDRSKDRRPGLALLNGVTDTHERTVVDAGGLVGALVLGQVILVHAAGMLDDDLGGVGKDDLAGVLGQGDLAGVRAARRSMPVPT